MTRKQSNPQLYDAIKERGRAYLVVFRELSKRYGEAEAVSVMRKSSYEHGRVTGAKLRASVSGRLL